MKYLLIPFILATIFLAAGQIAFSQQPKSEKPEKNTTDTSTAFPKSFTGHWQGTMEWNVSGKPAQQFQMQLIIRRDGNTGEYLWQIIYGDQGKDNRPYRLKAVEEKSGHWVIDEQNGILLDGYVHGRSFHGAFTVGNNTIIDNYRADGNKMHVEFFTVLLNDKKASGEGTEASPNVLNYRISSYQSGVLTRLK